MSPEPGNRCQSGGKLGLHANEQPALGVGVKKKTESVAPLINATVKVGNLDGTSKRLNCMRPKKIC